MAQWMPERSRPGSTVSDGRDSGIEDPLVARHDEWQVQVPPTARLLVGSHSVDLVPEFAGQGD